MRFTKLATLTGVAAALFIGAAGTGSAADNKPLLTHNGTVNINDERGVSAQRTNGEAFLEINAQGRLVYWTRAGESFAGQQRGTDWQNTRAITSLDNNHFLEISGTNRLVVWTWNGSFYTQKQVGTGWDPARLITAVSSHSFLEINAAGDLRRWDFDQNYNISGPTTLGTAWDQTKAIAGKDFVDFIEVKGDNKVSEWFDFNSSGHNLQEIQFTDADFSNVRLIIGTDFWHFVTVDAGGQLVEYTLGQDGYYYEGLRGQGWDNARLIG